MRQRTKVAEWWERRLYTEPLGLIEYTTEAEARADRAVGGTLHHVTRYRLAPLVKLTLRRNWEYPSELDATHANGVICATIYERGWSIWGPREQSGDAHNVDAAKAACAARLLEFGYLVVGNG